MYLPEESIISFFSFLSLLFPTFYISIFGYFLKLLHQFVSIFRFARIVSESSKLAQHLWSLTRDLWLIWNVKISMKKNLPFSNILNCYTISHPTRRQLYYKIYKCSYHSFLCIKIFCLSWHKETTLSRPRPLSFSLSLVDHV